jgi:hypothetical protein
MVWIYYILLLLFGAVGLFMVLLTLPGLWLMTAAAAGYFLLTHHAYLGAHALIALLVLALLSEAVEIGIGGAAARKAGGGRRGMIGGIIGGIVGGLLLSFILPVVLTVVGVCFGSFIGAATFEMLGGEPAEHSLRVGLGAAKGRFLGVIGKLCIGLVMLLIIAWKALPV